MMIKEKELLAKLIAEHMKPREEDDDPEIDYASEYKKQTGKDLETGEYVTQ